MPSADDLIAAVDIDVISSLVPVAAAPAALVVLLVASQGLAQALIARDVAGLGLRVVLSAAGEAAAVAAATPPDVALVDLAQERALDVCSELAQEPLDLPVLAAGHDGTESEALEALAAGACGYLAPESLSLPVLRSSLIWLASGHFIASPAVGRMLRAMCRQHKLERPGDEPLTRLTGRQRDVVRLAASGMRNDQIATELNIELSTVKKHLHSAFRRLEVEDRRQLRRFIVPATAGPEF